jgi:ATP-binding cassette subfamily G (WHITE) protein 2 (PDR)
MENTQQGLRNQLFGVFVFLFVIVQLVLQIIPSFVTQRTLYESRERQSKTYAWQAFILSNITVELFWNTVSRGHFLANFFLHCSLLLIP